MFALAVIAETNPITALPRQFAATHAQRFGVISVEAPPPLAPFGMNAVASKAALMDAGLSWLFDLLAASRGQTQTEEALISLTRCGYYRYSHSIALR